jgi:hypothetical protein
MTNNFHTLRQHFLIGGLWFWLHWHIRKTFGCLWHSLIYFTKSSKYAKNIRDVKLFARFFFPLTPHAKYVAIKRTEWGKRCRLFLNYKCFGNTTIICVHPFGQIKSIVAVSLDEKALDEVIKWERGVTFGWCGRKLINCPPPH